MVLKTFCFLSLLFLALALGASLAHLYELPHKINLSAADYLTVQQIYRGWALLGIAVFGALGSTLAATVLLRGRGARFILTLAGFLCIAAAQVIFWVFTYPVNQATNNWTVLPADWLALRDRWEYSHAAGAVLNLLAFTMLVLSLLVRDTGDTKREAAE